MSAAFKSLTAGIRFKFQNINNVNNQKQIEVKSPFDSSLTDTQQKNSEEALNIFRKQNRIKVNGFDIPPPIPSWEYLKTFYSVPDNLMKAITSVYSSPTPVQMQTLPILLKNRELLVTAPTGSGKTAAYLIPIIHLLNKHLKGHIRAIILAPTRELSDQIQKECTKFADCRGLISVSTNKGDKIPSGIDILVSTPNRLVYALKDGKIDLTETEYLIIDESDRLFEAGDRGFREQLAIIYKACSKAKKSMFSATLAPDVENWCKLNLDNVLRLTVGTRNEACNDVKQELIYAGSEKGKTIALQNLIDGGIKPPVLIFVQEMDRANELKEVLEEKNKLKVDVIHSKRSQLQREQALKLFRAGRNWILICTELMSRGIDVKGVNLVINYDFPPSTVSYIHRVGRTGRAGRPGRAVTFFTDEDKTLLRSIAQIVRSSGNEVPDYMLKLKKAGRKEKRKLKSKSVKREAIKTESKYDQKKRLKKERYIASSKKKKAKSSLENTSNSDKEKIKKLSNEPKKRKLIKMTEQPPKKKKKVTFTKKK